MEANATRNSFSRFWTGLIGSVRKFVGVWAEPAKSRYISISGFYIHLRTSHTAVMFACLPFGPACCWYCCIPFHFAPRGVQPATEAPEMKRSKTLTLALMSATALSLAACDDSTEVAVFETIEQCASQDGFDAKACETNMQMARDQHIQVAPKYSSVADCESDFGAGQCETAPQSTTSGGSIFMPLMMGYMMGNMLSGRSNVATQPLYRSRDDAKNFRTADNRKVAGNTGISKVAGQAARAPSVKTSTVRRGGFGATARASTGGVSRSFGS